MLKLSVGAFLCFLQLLSQNGALEDHIWQNNAPLAYSQAGLTRDILGKIHFAAATQQLKGDGELPDFEGKEDFEQAKVNLQEKSGQSGGGNPGTSGTELGQKPAGMAEEQAESQASSSKKESKIGEKKGKSGGRSDAMKHGKNSKEKGFHETYRKNEKKQSDSFYNNEKEEGQWHKYGKGSKKEEKKSEKSVKGKKKKGSEEGSQHKKGSSKS